MATVRHPTRRGKGLRVQFLVDTGAIYTVLPRDAWRRLRLEPVETADFTLADGTVVERVNPLNRRVLPMRMTLAALQ
jgi:predicted aspartyl protease